MTNQTKPDFETVIQKYDRRLFNLMLRLTANYHNAQDLTQEVFLIAYKEYPKFRGESDVFTWLYRIAVNHHRRFARTMKVKRWLGFSEVEDSDQIPDPRMESLVEQNEEQQAVSRAVASLHEEFKETVLLYYFEDKDCDNIARILNCSPGTVKSRLWRGRKMLARKLKNYVAETEGIS